MTDWLRRNRWFLVALVVLVPGALVVSLIPRFFPYLETQPNPEHVELGDVVRYGNADIQLTALELLDGVAWNAPAGADVVVATFSIDVIEPGEFVYCDIVVVSTEGGLEREWEDESFSDSDYEIPEYFADTCDLDEVGRYHLQATFLVPRGQVTEPVVQFSSSVGLPRALRLS